MFVILLACTVQKELLLSDYMIASEVILLIISNYIVPVKVEVGSIGSMGMFTSSLPH